MIHYDTSYFLLNNEILNFFQGNIEIHPIYTGGSARKYFRLIDEITKQSFIYCVYTDLTELERFIHITNLLKKNINNIQNILFYNYQNKAILLQDLGNFSVFDFYHQNIKTNRAAVFTLYQNIIDLLIKMQTACSDEFKNIYPQRIFDKSVYLWETDYFKNMVLDKYLNAQYNNNFLLKAFQQIADFLAEQKYDFFLHRDFQSQNILIFNNDIYFIDYQTAYCGSNFYDVASLLFDPYINADIDFQKTLYEYYKKKFSKNAKYKINDFDKRYELTILQRLMQANAAYVKLGIIENKPFFKNYINSALSKIAELILNSKYIDDYLKHLFQNLKKDGKILCAE
ncbi:MAG TPA: phosphotransferase [bacterium]|nr:phosphotransferase [bacterium]